MIIVGDIHGDYDLMKKIVERFSREELVFLGDLCDSRKYSIKEQFSCVELGLNLVKEGRAKVILGNHELAYLPYNRVWSCSGYSPALNALLIPYYSNILEHFVPFLYFEDAKILLTHAGLTNHAVVEQSLELEKLGDWLYDSYKDRKSVLYRIGRSRGGEFPFGGIWWCDFYEEFEPLKGIFQVFGHTPVKEAILTDNYAAIDCLQSDRKLVLRLDVDKGEVELLDLNRV
jgi:predicted phosphodiesterase